jgi:hypothetical protein
MAENENDKDDDAWVIIDSKTETTTINKDEISSSKIINRSNLIKVVKIMDKIRSSSRSNSCSKK